MWDNVRLKGFETMTLASITKSPGIGKCPIWQSEFNGIRANHATLASTGCTKEICQAGRAVHTDEPRVGENRASRTVEREAKEFLQDLHREGIYGSEDAFQRRLKQVLEEIRSGATEGVVREDRSVAAIGGVWTQTSRELEFGVRRAWRNSRKCIMRSHCEELKLCDLRKVTSSTQMAAELIKGVQKAFNQGIIQPTVFVFPPRAANGRGPMILNHQVLQFAGYEADDGSVIGDAGSIELTKAIIDLGWQPPEVKSRWDILPLVTMAEGDRPCIAELPASLRKLVDISHPYFATEFEQLNLKWVSFPALTRLGFDIGGVQYTATPFIGWFMDAEIGVRNLADPFRYNALPDIVKVLGLMEGRLADGAEDFEDLAEYEKLAMLSRAQAELNYAVQWSFLKAKVTMTDSLTASMKWSQYDDEFWRKNGYRLPADPYWLAPPQGSIIPLWHRGGAPNYQPKPMICKHVQDPMKAWNREKQRWPFGSTPLRFQAVGEDGESVPAQILPIEIPSKEVKPDHSMLSDPGVALAKTIKIISSPPYNASRSIAIYFCSAATVAEKLAAKLHKWTKNLASNMSEVYLKPHIEPLNCMKVSGLTSNNIILLVVSSTGLGEIPPNGSNALAEISREVSWRQCPSRKKGFQFAIFGNGDSRYSNTFNGAAVKFNDLLREIGGNPLAGGIFKGDVAIEPIPLRALKHWFTKLEPILAEAALRSVQRPCPVLFTKSEMAQPVIVNVVPIEDAVQLYNDHQLQLLSTLREGTLTTARPKAPADNSGSRLLNFDICTEPSGELSCIQVLPLNAGSKIKRALLALRVEASAVLDIDIEGGSPTYSRFLTEFVDFELPFMQLQWLSSIDVAGLGGLTKEALSNSSMLGALECLHEHMLLSKDLRRNICLDMPLSRTRTYSVASSNHYLSMLKGVAVPGASSRRVDIMVKVLPGGRFSDIFLNDSAIPSLFKYRIVDSLCGPLLRQNYLSPFVIVATGAGFGPVRCLLQWRIAAAIAAGRTLPPLRRGISLFLGFKECDLDLALDTLNEAMTLDLVDVLDIVVSNPEKRRVYDNIPRYARQVRDKVLKSQGMVFVCSSLAAAQSTKRMMETVLGGSIKELVKERYVEEVY